MDVIIGKELDFLSFCGEVFLYGFRTGSFGDVGSVGGVSSIFVLFLGEQIGDDDDDKSINRFLFSEIDCSSFLGTDIVDLG